MNQIIISVFAGFIIIEEFNIQSRIRINISKRLAKFKLVKCLPCFTFWSSLIIGLSMNNTIKQTIINSMAAYIIAVFLDNRR